MLLFLVPEGVVLLLRIQKLFALFNTWPWPQPEAKPHRGRAFSPLSSWRSRRRSCSSPPAAEPPDGHASASMLICEAEVEAAGAAAVGVRSAGAVPSPPPPAEARGPMVCAGSCCGERVHTACGVCG